MTTTIDAGVPVSWSRPAARSDGGGAAVSADAAAKDDDAAEMRILQRAQERAVQMMHKEKSVATSSAAAASGSVATTTTQQQQQPTSFSLFAAGGMSLLTTASTMVTWDGICEQAATTKERLALLQKVEFIDDILPDWETHVRPFLQKALRDIEDCGDDSAILACVRLHRKWFHRTRGSHAPEYQSLQLDLLENLVEAVNYAAAASQTTKLRLLLHLLSWRSDDEDSTTLFLKPAIKTSLDMFADLVDRDSVKDYQRRNAIGKLLWTRWIPCPTVRKIMVRHDTLAVGFSQWILGYLNAADTVSLLLLTNDDEEASPSIAKTTTLVELLFRGATRSTEAFAVPTTTTTTYLQQWRLRNVVLLPVACFTLSILRSALVVTRVSTFPWTSLLGPQSQHDRRQRQRKQYQHQSFAYRKARPMLLSIDLRPTRSTTQRQ